ncbi:sigma-54-dependent transcriptional regulator, partial [Acidobacteriota bacterium]
MKTILIIDDDPLIRKTLSNHISKEKNEIILAENAEEGIEKFSQCMPDLIILDIRLPDMDGLDALKMIKEKDKNACIIIMTAYDDMRTTVEAIKLGAFEYLVKPLDYIELDLTIEKAFQVKALEEKLSYLVEEKQREYTIDNIIGRSSQMREIFKLIGSVSITRTNVLIQGESGTGKELVAKAI